MDLRNKRVLIVGSGLSGIAAGKLLEKKGASIVLLDGNKEIKKEQILSKLPEGTKIKVVIGSLSEEDKKLLELVVLSPGVPTDLHEINELRQMAIPIWGEIELAYVFGKGTIAAITGTNGKTTTTALLGEIVKTCYSSTYVVGNIGIPYTDIALNTKDTSIIVAEMSSFQLETIHTFKPNLSAILNITPDHLNRHHTMEAYIEAKVNITKNQDENDVCVLNYEDEILRKVGAALKCKVYYFSSKRALDTGIYLDEQHNIIYSSHKEKTLICNDSELKLLGIHSYENVMAAVLMAIALQIPIEKIKMAIKAFEAVEHRIEYVAERKGVKYYNDSKGTNPDAAIKGIEAMNTPTVLIGGGYDKNSEYEEWIHAFSKKVTYLVLVGQTKEKIKEAALRCGFTNIILADTFEEAVKVSGAKAKRGEAVLLSPACASWGMFQNYEERGKYFKELVYKMEI